MSEETQGPIRRLDLFQAEKAQYDAEIRQRITRDVVEAALKESGGERCTFQLLVKLPRHGVLSDLASPVGDRTHPIRVYLYSLVDETYWKWSQSYAHETRCIYLELSVRKPTSLPEPPVEKPVSKVSPPVPKKEPGCVLF